MNYIPATIESIEVAPPITYICGCSIAGPFSSLIIHSERPTFILAGAKVHIGFKESDAAVSIDFNARISIRNRFYGTITTLHKQNFLARLTVTCNGIPLAAIISAQSAEKLGLFPGLSATLLVKSSLIVIVQRGLND